MGYYQGDHYRSRRFAGDYYRGDPGFFSFIGGALKGLVSGIGKVASFVPGPIGIAGKALTVLDQLKQRAPGQGLVQQALGIARPTMPEQLMLGPGNPNNLPGFPGGGIITQSPMGTPVHPAAIAMQLERMRHTHPNKSTYITRGGGTSRWPQQLIVHPKHTEAVTNRRMNVGNARALRRALRRARGFAKLAHKVLRVSHQFKGKGFGRAKARRR